MLRAANGLVAGGLGWGGGSKLHFYGEGPKGLGKRFEWKKVRMNQNLCSDWVFFEIKETQIF